MNTIKSVFLAFFILSLLIIPITLFEMSSYYSCGFHHSYFHQHHALGFVPTVVQSSAPESIKKL